MSCLILDKSPQIRESLSHLLLVLGIKGIPVGSRQEGLVVLDKDNEIDTAIVDVDNKDTEGLELIQEIKNSEKTQRMTIIVHSAQSSREFVTKTMAMGIHGYLLKPFQEDKTFQRLKTILIDNPDLQSEKRQHIRVNPDPNELLRLHFRISGYDKLVSGRIRNISMGGVALELHSAPNAELLKPGAAIHKLQFVLMSKPLSAICSPGQSPYPLRPFRRNGQA